MSAAAVAAILGPIPVYTAIGMGNILILKQAFKY